MRTRFALPYGMLSVVGAILVLAGCSRRTADPLTGPSPFPTARGALESSASLPVQDPVVEFGPPLRGGAFVDLASGRLTRADFLIRIRTQQPTGPPEPWFEVHRDSRNWRITRDVERNGLRYAVEEMTVSEFPGDPFETWFRQDRSGLFVYQEDLEPGEAVEQTSSGGGQFQSRMNAWLDSRPRSPEERTALLAATDRIAARRAAIASALGRPWEAGEGLPIVRSGPGGGPAQAEITFLRYPLHPGARWDGRIGFNVWTVEALEWLSTPAGRFASARLRIDLPELFGPADVYRTWFARPGEVQRRAHFEDEVIGEDGNPKAIVEVEELLDLVEYVPGTAD